MNSSPRCRGFSKNSSQGEPQPLSGHWDEYISRLGSLPLVTPLLQINEMT